MSAEPTAGQLLDGLGLELELEPGDLVESAVVIARVVQDDNTVTVLIGNTGHIPSLDQHGLISVAYQLTCDSWRSRKDDE